MIVGWVAEHFPELVREIRDAGHEIGLHGHWHRRVYELSPDGFREDLRLNIAALQRCRRRADRLVPGTGMVPEPARAVGVADPRRGRTAHRRQPGAGGARRVAVVSASAASDCHRRQERCSKCRRSWDTSPGMRCRSVGDGACARPNPRRSSSAIAANNRQGDPAVLTVHPWEIDPAPPYVRLPAPLAFSHYYRLSGFRTRLREVLAGAEFGPLRELPDAEAWLRA